MSFPRRQDSPRDAGSSPSQTAPPVSKEHATASWSVATWQRYLPPDFPLSSLDDPSHWSPDEQNHVLDHLQAIWHAVQTYLPRRAVRRLLNGLDPGEMWGEMSDGTFLFADISGFTALADHLSALPDGTEKLTELINDYFTTMLQVVDRSCRAIMPGQPRPSKPEGSASVSSDPPYDLLKFGGDAMLLLFSGPDHARLAIYAALRMQQNMLGIIQKAQALGATSLGMHIGVNSGRFLDAHVGTSRTMKKVEVGRTLNLTASAETMAASGQIAIGPGTHAAVRDWVTVRPVANDFHLVGKLKEIPSMIPEKEIKAVTYHGLAIHETENGLEATIVFDV